MLKFAKNKRKSTSKELSRLDLWFSRYIRLRDTENDLCRCITCGAGDVAEKMDCGHFISRDRWSHRYNEMNVAAQCRSCNRFNNGLQWLFGQNIDKKYGRGTSAAMQAMASRKGKLKTFEMAILADAYHRKANAELQRSGAAKWW